MSALGKVAPNQTPAEVQQGRAPGRATRSRGLAKLGAAPAAPPQTDPGGVWSEAAGLFPCSSDPGLNPLGTNVAALSSLVANLPGTPRAALAGSGFLLLSYSSREPQEAAQQKAGGSRPS